MGKMQTKDHATQSQTLCPAIIKHPDQESLQGSPSESNIGLPLTDYRIQVVIDFITSDLSREHSLDELAQAANLSTSRLRHLFKEQIGITLAQFHRDIQMQEAKKLLETTFLTVQEVRNKIGITDEWSFLRAFKRVFGLTPSEYRRRCLASRCQSQHL